MLFSFLVRVPTQRKWGQLNVQVDVRKVRQELELEKFNNAHKCHFFVLQKPVCLIWSCPKNYLSVRMSQANFGRHENFKWLFRLIRKCQLPLWVPSRVRRHEVALLSFEFQGTFCLCTEIFGRPFFNNNRNITWY